MTSTTSGPMLDQGPGRPLHAGPVGHRRSRPGPRPRPGWASAPWPGAAGSGTHGVDRVGVEQPAAGARPPSPGRPPAAAPRARPRSRPPPPPPRPTPACRSWPRRRPGRPTTEAIWARTSSGVSVSTACTPRVFWAVTAVMAAVPHTPWASNVLRSATMPAPPLESEPAMVSATGRDGSRRPTGCTDRMAGNCSRNAGHRCSQPSDRQVAVAQPALGGVGGAAADAQRRAQAPLGEDVPRPGRGRGRRRAARSPRRRPGPGLGVVAHPVDADGHRHPVEHHAHARTRRPGGGGRRPARRTRRSWPWPPPPGPPCPRPAGPGAGGGPGPGRAPPTTRPARSSCQPGGRRAQRAGHEEGVARPGARAQHRRPVGSAPRRRRWPPTPPASAPTQVAADDRALVGRRPPPAARRRAGRSRCRPAARPR